MSCGRKVQVWQFLPLRPRIFWVFHGTNSLNRNSWAIGHTVWAADPTTNWRRKTREWKQPMSRRLQTQHWIQRRQAVHHTSTLKWPRPTTAVLVQKYPTIGMHTRRNKEIHFTCSGDLVWHSGRNLLRLRPGHRTTTRVIRQNCHPIGINTTTKRDGGIIPTTVRKNRCGLHRRVRRVVVLKNKIYSGTRYLFMVHMVYIWLVI